MAHCTKTMQRDGTLYQNLAEKWHTVTKPIKEMAYKTQQRDGMLYQNLDLSYEKGLVLSNVKGPVLSNETGPSFLYFNGA